MVIDCDTCIVRGLACRDCVVSVLLGHPGMPARSDPGTLAAGSPPAGATAPVDLDVDQHRALGVLADAGMVPRLRLVPADQPEARRVG